MKLKKIASLMLAGVMAVSMLAGCSGNTNSNPGEGEGNTAPSSTFTSTVLEKTSAATQLKLSASSNTKLDNAVAYAARNNTYNSYVTSLKQVSDSGNFYADAYKYMAGATYNAYNVDTWNFAGVEDSTYWVMYAVSNTRTDEWIANEIAKQLDDCAKTMHDAKEADGDTYEYTVSVVKAECPANDNVSNSVDTTLIGIAITTDYTKAEY